jgi:hypothetical protein
LVPSWTEQEEDLVAILAFEPPPQAVTLSAAELALLALIDVDPSPGIPAMAYATGLRTRQGVQRMVNRLVRSGFLIVTQSGTGRWHRTVYGLPSNCHPTATQLPTATATQLPTEPRAQARPLTLVLEEIPGQILKNSLAQFDRFWAAYPKKVGKPSAQRAWKKLTHSEREAAIAAVPLSGRLVKRDRDFQPHPATWLNDRAWEDEDMASPMVTRAKVKISRERYERGLALGGDMARDYEIEE